MVQGPELTLFTWTMAALPVVALFGLVISGKVKTPHAAGIVAVLAMVIGATVFEAGPRVLAIGTAKGIWLASWILAVVWPALLLYRLAARGGMERIGRTLQRLLPSHDATLLALAWVLPSFIQGVAGFGTPIAVAAPLLVSLGYPVRRALVYTLVGYHWAVTFGSMGSSFYMASLTAGLTGEVQELLALRASSLLALNCLIAGALVLLLDGGVAALRRSWQTLLLVGVAMGGTLIAVSQIVPALASLSAGTAGFAMMIGIALVARRRASARTGQGAVEEGVTATGDAEGESSGTVSLLSPYLYLMATALPVLAIPASRAVAQALVVLGPDFPRTVTGTGWVNPAVESYTPLAVAAHPGSYLLLASLLGYLTYRRAGLLGAGEWRPVVVPWVRSLPKASAPVLLLAVVATLLTDAGMVQILAEGVAQVAGAAYPLAAAWIGAIGSFATGSTTASNALFAAFQLEVGQLLEIDPTILVAAQTAGGNVGNAISPVDVLVGLSALGDSDELSPTMRSTLRPILVLLVVVTAMTVAMIAVSDA